jgi:2-oxo-4-hydroxy-4-carboxy--5-ureidoimidazoline (OHCU) decarboxylase
MLVCLFLNEWRELTVAKIAVEQPFEDIKTALEAKGHEVQMFATDENVSGYDIGVVRAINEGHNDEFGFPVVSMKGMSIEDVVDAVETRVIQM